MTQPPKNETAPEAPLTWTSDHAWGSFGRTHYATVTRDRGDVWKFVVDQPRKGYWTARGWRNGVFKLYREDLTMKGAKAQAQAYVNFAATSTCGECRDIGGHTEGCATLAPAPVAQLTAVDEGGELLEGVARSGTKAAGASRLSGMVAALARHGLKNQARGLAVSVWTNRRRPSNCTCPTPTHRMSCGAGARPVVVSRCTGCGENASVGAHGPNQGFGGCV